MLTGAGAVAGKIAPPPPPAPVPAAPGGDG
jgi:hypothetical protein